MSFPGSSKAQKSTVYFFQQVASRHALQLETLEDRSVPAAGAGMATPRFRPVFRRFAP